MKFRFPMIACLVLLSVSVAAADDPLPSWTAGAAKQSIIDFVRSVTVEGSPDFVPPEQRIAVFDNDGTLWSEYPGSQSSRICVRRNQTHAS